MEACCSSKMDENSNSLPKRDPLPYDPNGEYAWFYEQMWNGKKKIKFSEKCPDDDVQQASCVDSSSEEPLPPTEVLLERLKDKNKADFMVSLLKANGDPMDDLERNWYEDHKDFFKSHKDVNEDFVLFMAKKQYRFEKKVESAAKKKHEEQREKELKLKELEEQRKKEMKLKEEQLKNELELKNRNKQLQPIRKPKRELILKELDNLQAQFSDMSARLINALRILTKQSVRIAKKDQNIKAKALAVDKEATLLLQKINQLIPSLI